MDRNRDARRGSMAAVNGSGGGGGLSRRRQQRSTNLRDSPEEDGAMEMQESSRLRDRGVKKDRDWDRDRDRSSSRSKRRRGDRLMHGSNREEGDDSSEESMEDDDEEEEDGSVAARLPAAANSSAMPSSSSLIQQQNHHHVRKSGFSVSKPVRPAASWKVADEMIGVSIPRKARTSSLKRPQEYSVSGGGGSGELIHRQASTSPARPSPSSTPAMSPPSSSNASVRKKKPISATKHRPPKMVKSPSTIQEIEIEVAEVLYGMTRQAPPPATSKQEGNKVDTNGLNTEAKSRASSPNSFSQNPATSQPSVAPSSNLPMVATVPKRKKPRLRFDEESPTSPASSVAPSNKIDSEMPQKTEEATSPRSEKNTSVAPAVENVVGSGDPSGPVNTQQDLAKPETGNQGPAADGKDQGKVKEEVAASSSKPKEASCVESNVNLQEATAATKAASANESPREEKFSIDLMALPLPEKSSSDRDGLSDFVPDHKSLGPEKKEVANGEVEKVGKASKHEGTSGRQNAEHFFSDEFELKKQTSKEKIPDLQLDLEKHDKEGLSLSSSSSKQLQQVPKQQQKSGRTEPKQEKPASSATLPLSMPMPIAGWPGGFPPFGYMGQVPSLQAFVPMDGNSGATKTVQQPPHFFQPQMRPKRCTTHCYIAQNIAYHQQISLGFWPTPAAAAAAAAAASVSVAPLYGSKQHNLNAVPPSETAAILGNPLQGGFPPRSMGPLQDKSAAAVAMAYAAPPPKEKNSVTAAANSNNYVEAAQRKQFLLQQTPQPGSSAVPPNMIHGPAFIFQPAMPNRHGGPSKSTPGTTGSAAPSATSASSAAAAGSGAAGHPATTVSFNYAGLSPSDAQYMNTMAILQNNAYPFPIAATQIGVPAYRGASPAQAVPFFNGPFYSSQMVPSQQQQLMQQQQQHQQQYQQHRQQQQQPPAHSQQGHQNPSTSSGSSSSQKHTQQSQRVPGNGASVATAGSNSHGFPASKQQLHLLPHQVRQLENETGCEDSPSTADSSRASQAQKGLYSQNFTLPMHSQNFALISPAAAAFTAGGSGAAGGSHSESKQSGAHHHQAVKMELTPSQAQAAQAYAMSFASFTGSAAAAQGFDFSSIVQNPVLMQNLTEGVKHGYQIPAAAVAAVAAAAQAAQHKKAHHEDGKSRGDSAAANANVATDDGKITAAGGGKNAGNVGGQHSLSFSRPDNDPTIPNFTTILSDANHRILNGGRSMIPPSSVALTSGSAAAASSSLSSQQQQQQQQQMIQFKQHQRFVQLQQQQQQHQHQHQHLQLQQQMSSRPSKSSAAHTGTSNVSSDRLPAGSATMAARFPQGGLAGFPPSLIQGSGGGGSSQSPHWKTSGRAATPAPASSATSSSSSAKNQMPQQQQQQQPSRSQQQPLLTSSAHQTQISFGVTSSNKSSSNPPLSSATAAAIAAGSPQNSVSKSSAAAGAVASSGSPRASSSSKSGQPPASVLPTLPLQQQQSAAAAVAAKNSSSAAASGLKSSPITNNNRNMASILGHPHITPSNSSSNKLQQQQQQQQQSQQQQQQLQKQSFQQPQLFFNNAFFQAQTSQSNAAAAAAGYFQQHRRQSEQQQQNSTTSGMLTLCPSSLTLSGANATSDPAKAAAASGIKGLSVPTQAGILPHTAQYTAATSMAPHPLMSAAFSYINTMPSSVSVKPASAAAAADQKQSTTVAGNENMHACWKPEKR